jgi:hypothetical protein
LSAWLPGNIDKIAATTPEGVMVKANAARMAHRLDPDAACDVLGSFRSLSLSLAQDIVAMA